MADPVPMDTSDGSTAGVIDATDPPTAADHAVPPPPSGDGDGDNSAMVDTTATGGGTSILLPPGRPITPQEEEEARLAIDLLRGDDVAGRVEAANQLEGVAAALGVERTRDVS